MSTQRVYREYTGIAYQIWVRLANTKCTGLNTTPYCIEIGHVKLQATIIIVRITLTARTAFEPQSCSTYPGSGSVFSGMYLANLANTLQFLLTMVVYNLCMTIALYTFRNQFTSCSCSTLSFVYLTRSVVKER